MTEMLFFKVYNRMQPI